MKNETANTLLHIGCGGKTLANLPRFFAAGWTETRVDVEAGAKPDIVAALPELEGVPQDAFDAAWLSHVIEHLFHHEAVPALAAIRRTLKPTGYLIVTCPDVRRVAEVIAKDGLDARLYDAKAGTITARDALYGWGRSIRGGANSMAHRNGFDLASLNNALSAAGFARIFGRRAGFDLWFIASRVHIEASEADDRLAAILDIVPSHRRETRKT